MTAVAGNTENGRLRTGSKRKPVRCRGHNQIRLGLPPRGTQARSATHPGGAAVVVAAMPASPRRWRCHRLFLGAPERLVLRFHASPFSPCHPLSSALSSAFPRSPSPRIRSPPNIASAASRSGRRLTASASMPGLMAAAQQPNRIAVIAYGKPDTPLPSDGFTVFERSM